MNLEVEQQVCSLDLAKRLKELGVKQESLFDWVEWGEGKSKLVYNDMEHNYDASTKPSFSSAFTVAELGEMLPIEFESGKTVPNTVQSGKGKWVAICYENDKCYADTEADARAKLLCYLLENKLISSAQ